MRRAIFIVAILVLLLGAGAWYIMGVRSGDKSSTYQFAEVTRGTLENTISSTGTLQSVGTVEVGTQVSGTIDRIDVDFNEAVRRGQVLAVLDTALLKMAVLDAEANLTRAQALHEQAQAEYDRNLPLFDKGYLSEKEFLPIRINVKTTQATVQSAQAALERALRNMRYAIIRSPISGTVIQRNVETGQTVAASLQAPILFVIAEDLSQMEIHAQVDESDIGQIKEGQPVRFTVDAYPDETFPGTVRQVRLQPTTIQNVVNYTVIVDARNKGGLLLPGMTATVDFVIEERKDVLLVPNAALRFQPTEEMVAEVRRNTQERLNAVRDSQKQLPQEGGTPRGQSGVGERKPFPSQSDMDQLWVLDDKGRLRAIPVRKGASDGLKTEITMLGPGDRGDTTGGSAHRPILEEGTQVISGVGEQKQQKSNANQESSQRRLRFRPF